MIIFTIICLIVIAMLLIICYALLAIAAEEDYKSKKMYEQWKKEHDHELAQRQREI